MSKYSREDNKAKIKTKRYSNRVGGNWSFGGIDPGASGAITVIRGEIIVSLRMPMSGSFINTHRLNNIFEHMADEYNPNLLVLEDLTYNPKWGKNTVVKSAKNYGKLMYGLELHGIKYQIIKSSEWKKILLAGLPKGKLASVEYVTRKFPSADLTPDKVKNPHDGIADSICLAEYGRVYL